MHTRAVHPNTVVHATDLDLTHEPVPAEQSVTGDPSTAASALTEFGGLEIGVWEMSVGTMTDVEADEVFVVLSGAATVEFADGSATLHLKAGDVGRLAAGAQTTWTVTETLRKIYLT
ncbi:cupin domain-containing protein [Mycobacterium sp. C31M]